MWPINHPIGVDPIRNSSLSRDVLGKPSAKCRKTVANFTTVQCVLCQVPVGAPVRAEDFEGAQPHPGLCKVRALLWRLRLRAPRSWGYCLLWPPLQGTPMAGAARVNLNWPFDCSGLFSGKAPLDFASESRHSEITKYPPGGMFCGIDKDEYRLPTLLHNLETMSILPPSMMDRGTTAPRPSCGVCILAMVGNPFQ
ncbi:hypothetical protein HUJ05_011177 [Dendroctonus ponderosae]|nr:hypothetical protein HUJ05_011177 [Dendroctonus ponderosae]